MESGNEILYKKIWEIVEGVNVEYEIVNVEYDTNNDFTVIDERRNCKSRTSCGLSGK